MTASKMLSGNVYMYLVLYDYMQNFHAKVGLIRESTILDYHEQPQP